MKILTLKLILFISLLCLHTGVAASEHITGRLTAFFGLLNSHNVNEDVTPIPGSYSAGFGQGLVSDIIWNKNHGLSLDSYTIAASYTKSKYPLVYVHSGLYAGYRYHTNSNFNFGTGLWLMNSASTEVGNFAKNNSEFDVSVKELKGGAAPAFTWGYGYTYKKGFHIGFNMFIALPGDIQDVDGNVALKGVSLSSTGLILGYKWQ